MLGYNTDTVDSVAIGPQFCCVAYEGTIAAIIVRVSSNKMTYLIRKRLLVHSQTIRNTEYMKIVGSFVSWMCVYKHRFPINASACS